MPSTLWRKARKRIRFFDLMGLGFSSKDKKIVRPVVPTVSIKVNGKEIVLPETPVRSTNANGIVGYNLYEATYNVPSGSAGIPSVTASASTPEVKVSIKQASSASGMAVVEFDYKGKVKTYDVVFGKE